MRKAAKMVLLIVGGLFAVLIVYLTSVAFGPGFTIVSPALEHATRRAPHLDTPAPPSRRDVSFEIDGTKLSAWLYLPADLTTPVPCVVMAHGLGGTKEIVLEAYALRFVEANMAALTFDYRSFGASEGQPRQHVWIPHQLEDVKAALAFARGLDEIDGERVAVWGTSAGGGYGITLAAEDPRHAAAPPGQPLDIYFGEHFERAVGEQIAFLQKHLLGGATAMAQGEET